MFMGLYNKLKVLRNIRGGMSPNQFYGNNFCYIVPVKKLSESKQIQQMILHGKSCIKIPDKADKTAI